MLLRILGYLCQLCFIIGLYYGLKSQEAFLQYTVCILAILILLQRIFIDLFWKTSNPQLSSSASFLRLNVLSSLN